MQSLPPNVAGGVVYPPAGPPSYPGTFSPAGSVEGSPMHGVYMNQPGQAGGGPYQAMPVSATGELHVVKSEMVETIMFDVFEVCFLHHLHNLINASSS